jgi:glutathione S-transferase
MPFGKAPVLEIDGQKFPHSMAILNYLGHKLKLAGSNDLESAEIEGTALFIYDLVTSE